MNHRTISATLAIAALPFVADAAVVAHFPMDVRSGQIVESVSGQRFAVQGHFAPENVAGAVGQALRFDGYTSRVDAAIGNILPEGTASMTVSLWVAIPETPIIELDVDTPQQTAIVSCLNDNDKSGFGFFIGFNGKWSFRTYAGGWPVNVEISKPMQPYVWNQLTAVVDGAARQIRVYNNGTLVGQSRASGAPTVKAATLYMGQSDVSRKLGPFELMAFNGLIDDVTVYDNAVDAATIASWKPENPADLSIPASRYAGDILRPRFHGMPATAWTNECHGMTYSDGKYHLFFQKNGNGPYMARLHWGHITSPNLYDWTEEKIAIAPGDPYDIKGCWSGCVFTDAAITGNLPGIIYTGVDYGHASIDYASPTDATLLDWTKSSANPWIAGRPSTVTDDFRDPYFFRNGNDAYIIVGSSENGVGVTTLHRYEPATKTWTNNGDFFFKGTNASQTGTFWEMPNITPMGNGKWLFTCTPLNTSIGVRTLYWTGTIDASGHFKPDAGFTIPKGVEMVSRDGFGLLSPTIYNHNGKTIALGIVPDKLPSETNWDLGWAHCYSLPREWSLNDKGELVQKPWETLTGLRTASKFERSSFDLDGTISLAPVSGRMVELLGVYEVGTAIVGFKIFKNGETAGKIYYNPASGTLTADFESLQRLVNDGGVYGGVYRASLPEFLPRGSELKLNVFVDHSIVDIFVNDRWATSIRVFPTDAAAIGVEAYAENGTAKVKSISAWNLSPSADASIGVIDADTADAGNTLVDVYSIDGRLVRGGVESTTAADGLDSGLYIIGNRKILVK